MAAKIAIRDRKKEVQWRRHMKAQAGSGLTVGLYCRRHALREHAFYWWRRELKRRDAELSSSPAFVPVRVTGKAPACTPTGRIEILLSGGRRVRVAGAVDRQLLSDMLSVLEAPGDRPSQRGVEKEKRC